MAGLAQNFRYEGHDCAMQAECCLNEAKVIGRQISQDGWKPILVLKFEKMEGGGWS